MNKWIIIGGVVVLAIIAVVFLSPSSRMSEQYAERMVEDAYKQETGKDVDVDYKNGNASITTDEGSLKTGTNVTLPSSFPSDVYVIDGTLTAAMQTAEQAFTVSIDTDMSISDVKSIYQEKMVSDGWEMSGVMDFGKTTSLMGQKGTRNMSVVISAGEVPGKTTVVLSAGEQ